MLIALWVVAGFDQKWPDSPPRQAIQKSGDHPLTVGHACPTVSLVSDTYYRLGHKTTGTALPLHWAYVEAFEWIDGEKVDNRRPGFQVWNDVARVVLVAATGRDADGRYAAEDYPTLLAVEAEETSDGAGEWFAVHPADVVSVRAIEVATVIAWARAQVAEEYKIGEDEDAYSEDEALEEWLAEHGGELAAWVLANAPTVETTWVETLPEGS